MAGLNGQSGIHEKLPGFSVYRNMFVADPESLSVKIGEAFRSDFFSITHITRGCIHMRINFQDVMVHANDLIISPPFAIKQIVHISPDCHIEGTHFTSGFFKEVRLPEHGMDLMAFFSSRHTPVWSISVKQGKLFSYLIRDLLGRVRAVHTRIFGKELLSNSFITLLYELAELGVNYKLGDDLKVGRKNQLVMTFITLARKHFIHERRLNFYGEHLFVTTKYLSETVKEITGRTATDIVDEFNIYEAKNALENGNLTVSEIAVQLRYSSAAFFSKFFKRHVGVSPNAYRNRHYHNKHPSNA